MASEVSQTDIFITADGMVELTVLRDNETVWLNQLQLASLFDTAVSNVNTHLTNIYNEGELDEAVTTENFSVVRQEGKRQVRRNITHYNLDAIISVGYRISSTRATQFRQWATRTLKQHLLDGYTINEKRLEARGIETTALLDLVTTTLERQSLINETGSAVMAVVQDYARSWHLLQRYDEDALTNNDSTQNDMRELTLTDAEAGIAQLKATLMEKGEASELFGQPHGNGLASILAAIEQGFGDTLYYPNIASRAAHLLYFVIKNHPFIDGNKRSGSFLFICYLQLNQHLLAKPVGKLINDNTLVALRCSLQKAAQRKKT